MAVSGEADTTYKVAARRAKVPLADGRALRVLRVRAPDAKTFITRRLDTGDVDALGIVKAGDASLSKAETIEKLRPYLELRLEPHLDGYWIAKQDARTLANEYSLGTEIDLILKKKAMPHDAILSSDEHGKKSSPDASPLVKLSEPTKSQTPQPEQTASLSKGGAPPSPAKPEPSKKQNVEVRIESPKRKLQDTQKDKSTANESQAASKTASKLVASTADGASDAVKSTSQAVAQTLADVTDSPKKKTASKPAKTDEPKSKPAEVVEAVKEALPTVPDLVSKTSAGEATSKARQTLASAQAKTNDVVAGSSGSVVDSLKEAAAGTHDDKAHAPVTDSAEGPTSSPKRRRSKKKKEARLIADTAQVSQEQSAPEPALDAVASSLDQSGRPIKSPHRKSKKHSAPDTLAPGTVMEESVHSDVGEMEGSRAKRRLAEEDLEAELRYTKRLNRGLIVVSAGLAAALVVPQFL